MAASLGGACILVRTSSGRVSASLDALSVHVLEGRSEKAEGNLLEDISSAAGSFNALLLGFGQLLDMPVHRVLE